MRRARPSLVVVLAAAALAGGWALAAWLSGPERSRGRGEVDDRASGAFTDSSSNRGSNPPPEHPAPRDGLSSGAAGPSRPGAGSTSAAEALPRPSHKLLPSSDASPAEWARAVERQREARSSVALQAMIEGLPIGEAHDAGERARLLALAVSALAAVGVDPRTEPDMRANARRAFDDLLASPRRDVRLAAMNAFALAYPDEREAVLAALESDPDPLIRAKAQALLAALR